MRSAVKQLDQLYLTPLNPNMTYDEGSVARFLFYTLLLTHRMKWKAKINIVFIF